jgi:hypothetical protein
VIDVISSSGSSVTPQLLHARCLQRSTRRKELRTGGSSIPAGTLTSSTRVSTVARVLRGRDRVAYKGLAGANMRYLFRTRRERVEIEA